MRRPSRILISVLLGLCAASTFAQTPPGLAMTKTCPPAARPESLFTCVFTIQNLDPFSPVINLAVTNTVPFPGGTPVAVPCRIFVTPVTTLQPFGNPGDTCDGSIDEISTCDFLGPHDLADLVTATGTDSSGHPVSGEVTALVLISDCPPPTTTNTPTSTPTTTPTTTPANTPTRTLTATPAPAPAVPTLNEPELLTFGLLIAAAGLLLLVRRR